MSEQAKSDWDSYVEGAKASQASHCVVELEWDAAILYAHNQIAELEAELSTLKAQREWVSVEDAELQSGEWVEAWHKVHECSITVTLGCGRETSSGHPEWREKTLTTSWPFEAMSHVRPLPPAPEGENE